MTKTSSGTIKAVSLSATTITLEPNETYKLGPDALRAVAKAKAGDKVTITYEEKGGERLASAVSVTQPAAEPPEPA